MQDLDLGTAVDDLGPKLTDQHEHANEYIIPTNTFNASKGRSKEPSNRHNDGINSHKTILKKWK